MEPRAFPPPARLTLVIRPRMSAREAVLLLDPEPQPATSAARSRADNPGVNISFSFVRFKAGAVLSCLNCRDARGSFVAPGSVRMESQSARDLQVGRQEIVFQEFGRGNPCVRGAMDIDWLSGGYLTGESGQHDQEVRVGVPDFCEPLHYHDRDAELLGKLPRQAFLRGLALLDLTSRELPGAGVPPAGRSLRDEHASVFDDHSRCYHDCLCLSHNYLILSFGQRDNTGRRARGHCLEERNEMVDWDGFANKYDRVFLENPQYRDTIGRMIDLAPESASGFFIDVGCGTGNLTEKVLERFGGAHVLGVDPSEGMRKIYEGRFEGRAGVNFAIGNALRLPADYDLFDVALSNLALHHVPPEDRDRCARELARVLKPGGTLVYGDMFCDVEGPPDDPARCRDIIEKMTAAALYFLEEGAYEMMMITLGSLPADLRGDGEYPTTVEVWLGALERAGFGDLEVVRVPPEEIGIRILRGVKTPQATR